MPISVTEQKGKYVVLITDDVLSELGFPETGKSSAQVAAEHKLATILTSGAQRVLLNESIDDVASSLLSQFFVKVGFNDRHEHVHFNHDDLSGFFHAIGYHPADRIIVLARQHASFLCDGLYHGEPARVSCYIRPVTDSYDIADTASTEIISNIDLRDHDRKRLTLIAQQAIGKDVSYIEFRDKLSSLGCSVSEDQSCISLSMTGAALRKIGVFVQGSDVQRQSKAKFIIIETMQHIIKEEWNSENGAVDIASRIGELDDKARTHLVSWLEEFRSQYKSSLFHQDGEVRRKCSDNVNAQFINELDDLLADLYATEANAFIRLSKLDGAILDFSANLNPEIEQSSLVDKMISIAAHCVPKDTGTTIQDTCSTQDPSVVEAFNVNFRFYRNDLSGGQNVMPISLSSRGI